jgi:hypothetical protein
MNPLPPTCWELLSGLPDLRSLRVEGCGPLGPEAVRSIFKLTSLTSLDLGDVVDVEGDWGKYFNLVFQKNAPKIQIYKF